MYKALTSFTTNNYDVRLGQIIDDNFIEEAGITEAEITEFLSIGYIRAYSPTEEGIISDTITNVWTGTQAQYEAITTPSTSTLYFIKEE